MKKTPSCDEINCRLRERLASIKYGSGIAKIRNMIGKRVARSNENPPTASAIPSKATIKASWDRMKIALSNPTRCMNIASKIRRTPVHDGEPRLARRAWRRVQISHAATIGIKKPWLYSSCADQRLTRLIKAPWKATAARTATTHPNAHPGTRILFGGRED